MEDDLKKLITDLLENINDTELLDLIYKLLLESMQEVQEIAMNLFI